MLIAYPAAELKVFHAVTRQKSIRETDKLCRADVCLADAFPALEKDTTYHYASGAAWSAHDMILHFLAFTGPAYVTLATWSLSEGACRQLVSALQDGRITGMACLFDWRVKTRCPDAVAIAKMANCDVRINTCHAKVYCLSNTEWGVSIVGSANLTNNPRIEAGVASTSQQAEEFHRGWIKAEIAKSQPFGTDFRNGKHF